MSPATDRRMLQLVAGAACLVPLGAGTAGVLFGAAPFGPDMASVDLTSHVRYLSGIFLGVGIAFALCIPAIERHTARFRLLGAFVVLGGLARAAGVLVDGMPSAGPRFGLVMELGVVPLLMLWQTRVARRFGGNIA